MYTPTNQTIYTALNRTPTGRHPQRGPDARVQHLMDHFGFTEEQADRYVKQYILYRAMCAFGQAGGHEAQDLCLALADYLGIEP